MIREKIEKLMREAVLKAFPEGGDMPVFVEISKDKNHGDYSSSVAFKIAQKFGSDPMSVAREISQEIKKEEDIEKSEAIAPGFVNFFVSKRFLKKEAKKIFKEKNKYGSGKEGKSKVVLVDYSSPNIAKAFGVGHLRSTIIGQAIYNIYKFRGWRCIGDNHLGDWGTQFGKLIRQIKEKKLAGKNRQDTDKIMKSLTIEDLEKLYVDFHKEAQNSPEMENEGRGWFRKLETGDDEARRIWQFCVEISLKEFDRIYELLGVKIDYTLGESFYLNMASEIIGELKEKGIAKESEGALIIDFSEELPSLIAVKSDGATTYLIRDLAAIKYRVKKWNPDLFIYEVGVDQSLYFKQLFKTVELLEWKDKSAFFHMAHGLVRWEHGKFSTRKGDTVHLEKILKEAIGKASEIIESSESIDEIREKKEIQIPEIVGIGAVKYNDLFQHHGKDIVFSWEKMLNLKGNSGPYIQYTFARCRSVLRKVGFNFPKSADFAEINGEEKDVLRMLIKFNETVQEAAENFSPNIICNFLFELAQAYNLFYSNNRILQAEEKFKKTRIAITAATAQVIKNGLELLGIEAPEKM